MKIEKLKDENEILLRINQLRGIFAIVVFLSHVWGYSGLNFLLPFNKIVTIAVSFFFFLSGYGMMYSFIQYKKYPFKKILIKIAVLLYMAVLVYIFSAFLEKVLLSYGANGNEFLPLSIKKFLISTNWYVYELIGFYCIFFVSIRFIKEKYQLLFIGFVSVIAFILFYYSGLVEAYYNSIIGFGFGTFVGKKGGVELMERYKNAWLPAIVVLLSSFAGMFFLDRQSIIFAVIRNFAAVGAIVIVLFIIRYLDINNKLLNILCRISPEIYFYHMPIALLYSQILKNTTIYVILVIVTSLFVALLLNPVNRSVRKLIKRRTRE